MKASNSACFTSAEILRKYFGEDYLRIYADHLRENPDAPAQMVLP